MTLMDTAKAAVCQDLSRARLPLARLRCLRECLECLRNNKPLPRSLCYVPAEIELISSQNVPVSVYSAPDKTSKKLLDVMCTTEHRVFISGEELFTTSGQWAKLIKITKGSRLVDIGGDNVKKWFLLCSRDSSGSDAFQPKQSPTNLSAIKQALFGLQPRYLYSWDEVVEHEYALRLAKVCCPAVADEAVVDSLSQLPTNWTFVQYEQISKLIGKHESSFSDSSAADLGCVKEYVESLEVSSCVDEDSDKNSLTDSNPSTFWESDGGSGSHWIRLKMKPGTIIRKLIILLFSSDDNYLPRRVIVMGGSSASNLYKLSDTTIEFDFDGFHDAVILSDQREHIEFIEIRIKECKDGGIDTRLHGIKIISSKQKEMGFNRDVLTPAAIAEYPLLDGFDVDILYQKAIVVQRFIKLLDSVLQLIVPRWEYSLTPVASLETAREMLSLSKKRFSLVDQFLRESETASPSKVRQVYIDRKAAMEHRTSSKPDPSYRKSVFNQLYECLKPREAGEKPLDYRWSSSHSQWWECKFIGEGIIDQGGGFRDSLSDLAEEICPSNSDSPLPLPFFRRSPNQVNDDASNFRDLYIPNSLCTEFHKFEWIGKLMGACFRSKENLVLSLAPFIWKCICNRRVSWKHDFVTVDEAQVKLIESMKSLSQEDFDAIYCGGVLTWSVTLSSGRVVPLNRASGSAEYVSYEDRFEYARLLEEARMDESKQQIKAIRNGLLQVVPEAVLDLFTWKEIEHRICGNPEIPFEALRKSVFLDSISKDDSRLTMLWTVLETFSNEDRSHFLRFVTGRRRLPVSIHLTGLDETVDKLPTSSTCGSTLYLPRYTSVKIMEEKIRYAVYNCLAIDTDTSAHEADLSMHDVDISLRSVHGYD